MEFQMIEQSAFDDMKTLVTSLRERAERFRELFSPPQPRRWLTAEEVCKALRITKRALQYYRSEGIIPSTSLGNKICTKNQTSRVFCKTTSSLLSNNGRRTPENLAGIQGVPAGNTSSDSFAGNIDRGPSSDDRHGKLSYGRRGDGAVFVMSPHPAKLP